LKDKYKIDVYGKIKELLKRLDVISGELISINGAISHMLKIIKKENKK
jgi:hypothetical protein